MTQTLTKDWIFEQTKPSSEIDVAVVVHVLQWSGVHDAGGGPPYGPMEGPIYKGDPSGGYGIANKFVPKLSEEHTPCFEAQAKAIERFGSHKYGAMLLSVLRCIWPESTPEYEDAFAQCAHASPLDRCKAMLLLAVEEMG